MRVLIVDDEPLAISSLAHMLDPMHDVSVVGTERSGRAALHACESKMPDLVFVDIEMPDMDGVTFARELRSRGAQQIIFVTAFDRFAIDAYEIEATDYVLKPVDPNRLETAVNRARDRMLVDPLLNAVQSAARHISLSKMSETPPPREAEAYWAQVGGKSLRIPLTEISHVEACKDYAFIYAGDRKHMVRTTMRKLQDSFADTPLQRIHKSYIVNLNHVVAVASNGTGRSVTLAGGAELPIGRHYHARLTLAMDG